MGNPGHPDLIAAEFKARARAGELLRELSPGEETARTVGLFLLRWLIVAGVGAAVIFNYENTLITAAVILVAVLAVVAEVWLWRRRSRGGELEETLEES